MASSESDKLDEITNALNEVNDILVEFNKQYNEIEKMDAIIINKLSNYKSIVNNSSLPDIEKIQYIISIKKLIITLRRSGWHNNTSADFSFISVSLTLNSELFVIKD